jgi:hypothetical protein
MSVGGVTLPFSAPPTESRDINDEMLGMVVLVGVLMPFADVDGRCKVAGFGNDVGGALDVLTVVLGESGL